MATLAEHNPDLARLLGVDPATVAKDAGYLGKLCIVTFQEPFYATGARRDPIGRLPPDFDRYGIVDREYRDRVQVGETWIVRPYSNHTGAVFLLPLDKVELASLLALDKRHVEELAGQLVRFRPDLTTALADLLPSQAAPKADPKEVQALRAALAQAQTALAGAATALAGLRSDVVTTMEEAASAIQAAVQQAGTVQSTVKQAAAVEVHLVRKERPATDTPIYLADTNLFINAERWRWEQCIRLLDAAGYRFRLAVTKQVHAELKHSYRLPQELVIVDVPAIDPALRELATANATALGKKAGDTDLSLIQALLDRPELKGIITEDPDIRNMHPDSIVRKLKGRPVECVTAAEFCEAHRKLIAA